MQARSRCWVFRGIVGSLSCSQRSSKGSGPTFNGARSTRCCRSRLQLVLHARRMSCCVQSAREGCARRRILTLLCSQLFWRHPARCASPPLSSYPFSCHATRIAQANRSVQSSLVSLHGLLLRHLLALQCFETLRRPMRRARSRVIVAILISPYTHRTGEIACWVFRGIVGSLSCSQRSSKGSGPTFDGARSTRCCGSRLQLVLHARRMSCCVQSAREGCARRRT